MIELAEGCAAPSPMPTPSRDMANSVKPLANAASPAESDQNPMQIASSRVLIQPSTSRPRGSANSA